MEVWYTEEHTKDVRFSIKVNRQIISREGDFQRIDVLETPEFGKILVMDGYLMLTEKDEFIYHEMIVHIPMAVNPKVENILVIGAGDGGTIRELTRYAGIRHIDIVEIDRTVVKVSK